MTRIDPRDLAAVETVTMKSVMRNGDWVRVPYILTRSEAGLSDRPVRNELDKVVK